MSYHLFSRKLVVARKPHRCIWCSNRIAASEIYYREASIYDGGYQDHAWHWDCWFDAILYFRETREEEFLSGMDRPEMLPFRSMEAA